MGGPYDGMVVHTNTEPPACLILDDLYVAGEDEDGELIVNNTDYCGHYELQEYMVTVMFGGVVKQITLEKFSNNMPRYWRHVSKIDMPGQVPVLLVQYAYQWMIDEEEEIDDEDS